MLVLRSISKLVAQLNIVISLEAVKQILLLASRSVMRQIPRAILNHLRMA